MKKHLILKYDTIQLVAEPHVFNVDFEVWMDEGYPVSLEKLIEAMGYLSSNQGKTPEELTQEAKAEIARVEADEVFPLAFWVRAVVNHVDGGTVMEAESIPYHDYHTYYFEKETSDKPWSEPPSRLAEMFLDHSQEHLELFRRICRDLSAKYPHTKVIDPLKGKKAGQTFPKVPYRIVSEGGLV